MTRPQTGMRQIDQRLIDQRQIDQREFRAVCGSFVTGVTVVTASSASGSHGSTVNSFTSLSTEPPQVVVCLARNTQTLRHVRASGRFAVNILAAGQTDVARIFASKSPDKLGQVGWHVAENGAPLLDGAVSTLECDVATMQEEATHMLVIGRVTAVRHDQDAAPLVFFRSTISAGDSLQHGVG
ncbi:flavin reductase family protein [Microbacterium pseudoresistens]|uniref:3-hydroxy-9,10-secoandrosta-1,3,5(10)-triene-9, 17-dione monooxygenase reductase component n=1 Tax=Microbacterium pseudoresistens TaxID=640634 RepID=A0A7Y9EVV7_9MICO|nr:flavin reductase family protein [Microbacterium pseudoresistens]NYD54914.1 3-hydroxy-9,10-secoandrosta-1,3,5(10)-triene-9,17-dione monooxygenase reductase component [Microbacterium pseudoresistens]